MSRDSAWDTLLECIRTQPRRRLLTGLAPLQPAEMVHFTELRSDEPESETASHIEYVHIHFPKLADAGYIVWNEQTDEIGQGPQFEEIEPFLELVQTHSEHLPEGWV